MNKKSKAGRKLLAKARAAGVTKPAGSPLAGLMSMLKADLEGSDTPAMKRIQTDIESAISELVELARTKDVPHEIFEILCRLREKANGHEFQWFEKHLPSRHLTAANLGMKITDHETAFGKITTMDHRMFKSGPRKGRPYPPGHPKHKPFGCPALD